MPDQIGQAAEAIANKTWLGGVVLTILSWAAQYNLLGWIAALCAIVGLGVNWYYKHKHYKLALKAFEAKAREASGPE